MYQMIMKGYVYQEKMCFAGKKGQKKGSEPKSANMEHLKLIFFIIKKVAIKNIL